MSATAKGDEVILSSWFTGTVQVIDRKTGATRETMHGFKIAANLPIGLAGAPGGLPTNIPIGVGVGASGTIYFSSNIENAIYKVTKK
jgi:hypothetical protein